MGARLCGMEEEAARSCCQAPLKGINKMSRLKDTEATYTFEKLSRTERIVRKILSRSSVKTQKKWLKRFGYWDFEDDLFEILQEEITNEINQEIIKKIQRL